MPTTVTLTKTGFSALPQYLTAANTDASCLSMTGGVVTEQLKIEQILWLKSLAHCRAFCVSQK